MNLARPTVVLVVGLTATAALVVVVLEAQTDVPAREAARSPSAWSLREVALGHPGAFAPPIGAGLLISPDLKRTAWVVKRDGKMHAVLDGVEGPPYDAVALNGFPYAGGDLGFSPDGRRLAYMARQGRAWWLVVDGVLQPETQTEDYWWVGGRPFAFTADSRRWYAHYGRLVLDGQVLDRAVSKVAMNRDGSRIAYLTDAQSALVVRGPGGEIARHPNVTSKCHCTFSPDGLRLTWSTRKNERWVLVENATEGPEFEELTWPVFSPDSKRLAYAGKRSGKWHAVIDGRTEGPYDDLKEGAEGQSVFFSVEGGRYAYAARIQKKWRVVVDGQPGEELDDVEAPVFSAAGNRLAFLARKAGGWRLVIEGAGGTAHDDVNQLRFSPDGRKLAYVGRDERKKDRIVLDGAEGKAYDEVAEPTFSPDGEHIAYAGRRAGKWTLVVDGEELAEFASFYYGLRMATDRRLREVGMMPGVDTTIVFDGPRRLNALIGRDKQLVRLEIAGR